MATYKEIQKYMKEHFGIYAKNLLDSTCQRNIWLVTKNCS